MPFTAPATYASKANTGYAAVFYIGDSASPPNYTAVAEVKTFNIDVFSIGEVENTHLLSPQDTGEFVPGLLKPGKVAFSGNFIGDASQLQISTLAQARTIFPFKIVAGVQRLTKTYTGLSSGYFSKYSVGPFEHDRPVDFQSEIQLSGGYTEGVA